MDESRPQIGHTGNVYRRYTSPREGFDTGVGGETRSEGNVQAWLRLGEWCERRVNGETQLVRRCAQRCYAQALCLGCDGSSLDVCTSVLLSRSRFHIKVSIYVVTRWRVVLERKPLETRTFE